MVATSSCRRAMMISSVIGSSFIKGPSFLRLYGDHDVSVGFHLGPLAGKDDGRRIELLDDGRSNDRGAGAKTCAIIDRRIDIAVALVEQDVAPRHGSRVAGAFGDARQVELRYLGDR